MVEIPQDIINRNTIKSYSKFKGGYEFKNFTNDEIFENVETVDIPEEVNLVEVSPSVCEIRKVN